MVSIGLNGITICIQIWVVLSLGGRHAVSADTNSEESQEIEGIIHYLNLMLTTWLILFLQNMYTGPRVTTQSLNRPPDKLFQALHGNGKKSETTRARNSNWPMAIHLGILETYDDLLLYHYSTSCQGLQAIWSGETTGSKATHKPRGAEVRVHFTRIKIYRCCAFRDQGNYRRHDTTNQIYNYIIWFTPTLYSSLVMLTHTITYPANRSLGAIREIQTRDIRNTSELQMYLPAKIDGRDMTTTQLMMMVDQITDYVGVTITIVDKTRLTTGLNSIKNGYVPHPLTVIFLPKTVFI